MPLLVGTETEIRVVPLKQWPEGYERRDPGERVASSFGRGSGGADLDSTIAELDRELRLVGAEGVVLQVDVSGDRIRKSDGLPYQHADVDPAVVLTFENEQGTQTYPADLYDSWVDNLRAIFYTLHDLRRISRHGVGSGSEQYRGFARLPGPGGTTVTMGAMEAARELAKMTTFWPDDILESRTKADAAYRTKAKWAHPDQGGDVSAWHRLQDARRAIQRHFGEPGGA